MFFRKILLYKSSRIFRVTFSPKQLKANLEIKLTSIVKAAISARYPTYLFTLSFTQSWQLLVVMRGIYSLGVSITTKHFEKIMPNAGQMLPQATEQTMPINAKMIGLLYLIIFMKDEPSSPAKQSSSCCCFLASYSIISLSFCFSLSDFLTDK